MLHKNNKKDIVSIKTSWEQIWLNNNSNQQVRDIKFAPKFNGLVLSVACADGVVKFYSPQSLQDLCNWEDKTSWEFKSFDLGCTCTAWNPAFDESPMILVGYESKKRNVGILNQNENNDSLLQLWRLQLIDNTNNKMAFKLYGGQDLF